MPYIRQDIAVFRSVEPTAGILTGATSFLWIRTNNSPTLIRSICYRRLWAKKKGMIRDACCAFASDQTSHFQLAFFHRKILQCLVDVSINFGRPLSEIRGKVPSCMCLLNRYLFSSADVCMDGFQWFLPCYAVPKTVLVPLWGHSDKWHHVLCWTGLG